MEIWKKRKKLLREGMTMRYVMVFLGVLLMGCSTVRTPLDQAVAPHFSHMAPQEQGPGQTATVVLVRDQPRALQYDYEVAVYVNQRERGVLGGGEKAVFYVEPGPVELSVKRLGWDWVTQKATIEAGETKTYRTGIYIDPVIWVPLVGLFNDSTFYIQPYGAPEYEGLGEGEG